MKNPENAKNPLKIGNIFGRSNAEGAEKNGGNPGTEILAKVKKKKHGTVLSAYNAQALPITYH